MQRYPTVSPDVGKVGASGAGLYGCFSLHARANSRVMWIMLEVLESCGDASFHQ
jgi:hypothetical protein